MFKNARPSPYRLSAVGLLFFVGVCSFLFSSYRNDLSVFVESRSSPSAAVSATASVRKSDGLGKGKLHSKDRSADRLESSASDGFSISVGASTSTQPSVEPMVAPKTLPPQLVITKNDNKDPESTKSSAWPVLSRNIADSQNRLIVLIASCPYLDLVDNLVQSLLVLGLQNFVVVPLDDLARKYAVDLFGADHVVSVPPFAPSFPPKQAKFNSPAFAKITSVRPQVLHAFLEKGYTIFYNDVDVVWRKNIFDIFDPSTVVGSVRPNHNERTADTLDMIAMVDSHPVEEAFICSCYLYLKPTVPMKNFLLLWQSLLDGGDQKKKTKYKNDQEAIYDAYQQIIKPKDGKQSQLKAILYPSDNQYFPSGAVYDIWPSDKQSNTYLVHNNFIRGHNFKINRFLKWNLWKPSSQIDEMDLNCSA